MAKKIENKSGKGYMLIAAIENNNNLVVLYENKDLDKVKEVAEILNSINEWGSYEEMRDASDVIEKIKELADLGVDLVGDNSPLTSKDDESLLEIEHFKICKVEVIKNDR